MEETQRRNATMSERIVVIAEKVNYTEKINMYSEELDFSTEKITKEVLDALHLAGYDTCHYESPQSFLDNIGLHKNDIIFSTLWGGHHSRNKRTLIPAICEAYDLTYVGADAFVQALCQNKYLTKLYLQNYKFSIPKAILVSSREELSILPPISFLPCIVKPNDEACSIGISSKSLVHTMDEVHEVASELLQHYSPILIEEFIGGKEISVCCTGSYKNLDIIEAVEVKVNGQEIGTTVWGFDNKRIGNGQSSREIVTNEFPEHFLKEAADLFYNLGKVDCCRIDGKYLHGNFYIIEISPDCSLSPRCFIANTFYYRNYTYPEMLKQLILYAKEDKH